MHLPKGSVNQRMCPSRYDPRPPNRFCIGTQKAGFWYDVQGPNSKSEGMTIWCISWFELKLSSDEMILWRKYRFAVKLSRNLSYKMQCRAKQCRAILFGECFWYSKLNDTTIQCLNSPYLGSLLRPACMMKPTALWQRKLTSRCTLPSARFNSSLSSSSGSSPRKWQLGNDFLGALELNTNLRLWPWERYFNTSNCALCCSELCFGGSGFVTPLYWEFERAASSLSLLFPWYIS